MSTRAGHGASCPVPSRRVAACARPHQHGEYKRAAPPAPATRAARRKGLAGRDSDRCAHTLHNFLNFSTIHHHFFWEGGDDELVWNNYIF